MKKARIGFIGVGYMGHGMAKNLVEKGHPLTILGNRNRAPVDDLVGRGAVEAKSAREVAAASDIVFLCVTDSKVVESLVRGPEGLAAGAAKGSVIVDCSTANPASTEALAAELAAKGVDFVDAPLGGTPTAAESGTVTMMVGADPAVFARIEPVFACCAAKIVHLGPVGAGHKMKLINNFLSMGYGAIYAEAIAIGEKVGIPIETFDKVIRGSRMDCGFYQTFMGYALEGNENSHQFSLSNAAKDVRYLDAMANDAKMSNPVGSAVRNLYAAAVGAGYGERYVPMLTDYVADVNGVSRRRKSK